MSRAKGSFGLVTTSTLNPNSLVLSDWGQPIVTGFNVRDDYMVYGSEPAAVDAVLS
jgi:glucosamine 6-phosphate synthetase-like amidotransferase/phosphosugar isomerase protein